MSMRSVKDIFIGDGYKPQRMGILIDQEVRKAQEWKVNRIMRKTFERDTEHKQVGSSHRSYSEL